MIDNNYIYILGIFLGVLLCVWGTRPRSAKEVVIDLDSLEEENLINLFKPKDLELQKQAKDLVEEIKHFDTSTKVKKTFKEKYQTSLLTSLFFFSASALLFKSPIQITIVHTFCGFIFGLVIKSRNEKKQNEKYLKSIQHKLPLTMEKLVMTVDAGLDIIAGIKVIVENAKYENNIKSNKDPIIGLLNVVLKLTESGIDFSSSLNYVAIACPVPAVKHCFAHLALAYKEGGELVVPLRELSDATQLNFQETVEEEIAKLPVKATMPLVVIFAGLLLFFITSPVIQIIDVTSNAQINDFKN